MTEETKTLTAPEIIALADAHAARVAAAQAKEMPMGVTAPKVNPMFARSKHQNFNPALATAYRNVAEKIERCCWLAADGKTVEPSTQVEIELPPFQLARGSKIIGEGDAFKPIPKKKDLFVDRSQAHFRAIFINDISDEMAARYPKWREWQAKTVENVRAACINMITCTYEWTQDAWQVPIKNAQDFAMGKINFPGKDKLNEVQCKNRIDNDPALRAEFHKIALASYIKNARYPFKARFDEATGEPLPPLVTAEAKVYASKKYDPAIHNNKAEGPNNVELPSCVENMTEVKRRMAMLVGKGGKGIDERVYSPLKFVNCMPPPEPTPEEMKKLGKRKASKDKKQPPKPRDMERPNIKLADGTAVVDYWWNPFAWEDGDSKGKSIQSYATAVLGFVLTCSEQGGYGVKCNLRNARKICLQDYEYVDGRVIDMHGERAHGAKDIEKPTVDDDDDSTTEDDAAATNEDHAAHAMNEQDLAEQRAMDGEEAFARIAESDAKRQKSATGRATAPTSATYDDL